uniref:NADH-ubiquinone oxidoreductase chain 5 n=1 Tax=Flustra foliacea TaxID=478208 RepID=H2ESU5_9BILA|nr:NADH dehydrogenase subunit 5 [Flustra foliacea]AEX16063.1 NADH dehydrogenase subunit 5 [Flustra foliacea]
MTSHKMAVFLLSSLLVSMLSCVYLCFSLKESLLVEWSLLYFSGLLMSFSMLFDNISLLFGSVVLLISLSVMSFSVSYMSGDINLTYFVHMVLLFVLSMNALIFCPHMIVMLLGWDGLGLTSYLLVIYYLNDKSLGAGMITAMTNRIGDALLVLGVSWAVISGHWSFVYSSLGVAWFFMFSLMLAAMTKSAQVPFSAWLPAAMAAPTPVSALVHSSTLVTAGVYLIIRFYSSLCLYAYFDLIVFFLGVVTCLMASSSAIFEMDLKKVIALSTLSQLGVMMMALGLGSPGVSFFHLLSHALFKALLFICAGTLIHSNADNQDIRLMGSISVSMPLSRTVMNIANLSLCGFPYLSGFYSKELVVEFFMMSSVSALMGGLMVVSICLTSIYTMRLSLMTLWSPFKGSNVTSFTDESKWTGLSYSLLLGGAVMGGIFVSWLISPVIAPVILPFFMKVLVLLVVFLLGVVGFFFYWYNNNLVMSRFMSSMWYLSFISASPCVNFSMLLGGNLLYNEATWMEVLGGKGSGFMVSGGSLFLSKSFSASMSQMLSTILLSVLILSLCFV